MREEVHRFDNLTDEEIEEGIPSESEVRSKWRKIGLITAAIVMTLILIIGYEIAPVVAPETGEYLLKWLRR